MINNIKHFSLTNHPMIHDEEALTTLELLGRIVPKINECIQQINVHTEELERELAKLPVYTEENVQGAIADGTIEKLINDNLFSTINSRINVLINQLGNLVMHSSSTEGNAELLDARVSHGIVYNTLGTHVRALGDGSAFNDAVRPGTVMENRIMPGMMGGDMSKLFTALYNVPMAGRWNQENGYFNTTLDFVAHSGYNVSDPIPCEFGDMFLLKSYIFGPLVKPAVVFDSSGNVVEVLGRFGESNWDERTETITVSHPQAYAISFIVGTSYVANFRAMRYTGALPDESAMNYQGYWHMHAKRRTDTITDRAQIKCWFDLSKINRDPGFITVNARLASFTNVKGWTFRAFASTSGETYDKQLPISAAGYTFEPDTGLRIPITDIPDQNDEGEEITHLAIFFDFLPEEGKEDEYMEVFMIAPDANGVYPENAELHGAVDTDDLNVVPPNASASLIYQKKLLGLGDSLMAGNRLKKYDSWFDIVADLRDMTFINGGVNGSPISNNSNDPTAMVDRIDGLLEQMPDPDYFILIGGANDLRLNIPIEPFKEDIRTIITKVRVSSPKCKILLGTNWKRTQTIANKAGHSESDYCVAMMEVAEEMNVPCVNNYTRGIDFTDMQTAAWADEGRVSGENGNLHFSKEANEYIARQYVGELERL